jgi:hypothetical protein
MSRLQAPTAETHLIGLARQPDPESVHATA